LGLLDTLSSLALFMAFGHLFFTAGKPLWVIGAWTIGLTVLGSALFAIRQRRARDDGFLAVVVYSAMAWFRGEARGPAGGAESTESTLGPDDDLAKSRFFAPAVHHYGAETTRGPHAVAKIMGIFVMVSLFWALFDQSGSSWIRQAKLMRTVTVLGFEILPSQLQAFNPFLVMAL